MAQNSSQQTSNRPWINTSASSAASMPHLRKQSSASSHSASPTSPHPTPKVQLIPHARTASFDIALTAAERDLLDSTNFDELDLSSQDFDFEDIFTYDKPQRKLARVVEVSTVVRERDWSNFSFSHYNAAIAARAKVNRSKSSISEKYLKNQVVRANTRKP